MRKLITVLIIFAATIALAVWEIQYSTSAFRRIGTMVDNIEYSLGITEKVDAQVNLDLVDELEREWNKDREVLFCLGNHATLRNVDEKLTTFVTTLRVGQKEETYIALANLKVLIEALHNDTVPVPSNLL